MELEQGQGPKLVTLCKLVKKKHRLPDFDRGAHRCFCCKKDQNKMGSAANKRDSESRSCQNAKGFQKSDDGTF